MNNFKDILKFILIVILLIVFSPAIFTVLGFVVRSLFIVVFIGIIAITGVVFYLRYKAKKLEKQYKEDSDLKYHYDLNKDNYEENNGDTIIDYSDSTIIDVEDYEENKKED